MNWGWKIAIVLAIYMIGIIAVVSYTMTLDVNLVAEDYYQQELAYEEQITRMKNVEALDEKPQFLFSSDRKLVVLTFPQSLSPEKGKITLFRPSDFTQDRDFKLELDDANQQGFVTESLRPGLWKAKVLWEEKGKSFYQEFVIVI
ncbi:MAG: FixH family protein [Bacteroidota bacterium]